MTIVNIGFWVSGMALLMGGLLVNIPLIGVSAIFLIVSLYMIHIIDTLQDDLECAKSDVKWYRQCMKDQEDITMELQDELEKKIIQQIILRKIP